MLLHDFSAMIDRSRGVANGMSNWYSVFDEKK
jgi:hypothetical protein